MINSQMIYLDNNATTRVDPRVVEIMIPYFHTDYGNASSETHQLGRRARGAVEEARSLVADLIGAASPDEIVFTSGATESVNFAIKGIVSAQISRKPFTRVITALNEHKAVLGACDRVKHQGASVTLLPVNSDGTINPELVINCINEPATIVSLMTVNNETGVVTDLSAISAACRERGVLLHTDATQALGKIPFDVEALGVDLASFSGHKFYGPKGVGALYVRRSIGGDALTPLMDGGSQERGRRAGTLNVSAIVGMAHAMRISCAELDGEMSRVRAMRERFFSRINGELDGVTLIGHPTRRVPGTLNIRFDDVEAESLMESLPELAFSAGSACSARSSSASHALRAMGLSEEQARSCVRFSIGRFNTVDEIDRAAERCVQAVKALRLILP